MLAQQMDGWMDERWTDTRQHETIIPHHYRVVGYKKATKIYLMRMEGMTEGMTEGQGKSSIAPLF